MHNNSEESRIIKYRPTSTPCKFNNEPTVEIINTLTTSSYTETKEDNFAELRSIEVDFFNSSNNQNIRK